MVASDEPLWLIRRSMKANWDSVIGATPRRAGGGDERAVAGDGAVEGLAGFRDGEVVDDWLLGGAAFPWRSCSSTACWTRANASRARSGTSAIEPASSWTLACAWMELKSTGPGILRAQWAETVIMWAILGGGWKGSGTTVGSGEAIRARDGPGSWLR